MRSTLEAASHRREDVSEALAALQAQADIAGAMIEAELSGGRAQLVELRRQLGRVEQIMTWHGELCQAIVAISGYIRRPIPLLRIEDLASLYDPPQVPGT